MPIINQVVKGGGSTPTGTKQITTNGIHDVAAYANADVQVPTTAPARYIEKTVDANGKLKNTSNMINFTGVTDVGDFILAHQYEGVSFPSNTSLDLSSLTNISGEQAFAYAFKNTSNLVSVDLSGVLTITGANCCQGMFDGCSSLQTVDISSAVTIGNMYSPSFSSWFRNCSSLTSVNFSSVVTILSSMGGSFYNCTSLTNLDFPELTTANYSSVFSQLFYGCSSLKTFKCNKLNTFNNGLSSSYGRTFEGCTALESVEFGGVTSTTFTGHLGILSYLFSTNTGSTAPSGCTIHFPSNLDPSDPNHTFDASTLTGYPTFGGDANYIHVAFDLPATE